MSISINNNNNNNNQNAVILHGMATSTEGDASGL